MENKIPVYIVNKKKFNPWTLHLGLIMLVAFFNRDKLFNYITIYFEKTIGVELASSLFIFIGMGFGLMLVNINSWFLSVVEPHRRGRASGLLASSFFIGQFLSPLLFQPIIELYKIQGLFFFVSCLTLAITISLLFNIIKKNNIKII